MQAGAEAFYFGRRKHLFGMYHPGGGHRDSAIVICPPLFNEYMRTHYALRRAAISLASRGHDVLRFDPSGQGNSTPQPQEVSSSDLRDDLLDAVDELTEISGASRLSVVAVRFGAAIACNVSHERVLSKLVFWDAILDGSEWIKSVLRAEAVHLRKLPAGAVVEEHEYMGQRMGDNFLRDFISFSARPEKSCEVNEVRTLPEPEDCARAWQPKLVEFDCGWEQSFAQVLYPHAIVETLCRSFE